MTATLGISVTGFQELIGRSLALYVDAVQIWKSGGWAMIAIMVIALVMFGMGMQVYLGLRRKSFHSVSEHLWRRWIDHPEERRGPIGSLLDFVTGGDSLKQTCLYFKQLRSTETAPFERDLRVMRICVSAAPLVGLLGTVTGMLATFGALAAGSGGEKTIALVASGISEALITTETGLVIALPGLFFQYQMMRKHERYKAFLAHLETVIAQKLHQQLRAQKHAQVLQAAQHQIAKTMRSRLPQTARTVKNAVATPLAANKTNVSTVDLRYPTPPQEI